MQGLAPNKNKGCTEILDPALQEFRAEYERDPPSRIIIKTVAALGTY